MQTIPHFTEMKIDTPDVHTLTQECNTIVSRMRDAASIDVVKAVIHEWDEMRKRINTWAALVHTHFSQDTSNEEYKKARDHADAISPAITEQEIRIKNTLLDHPLRDQLEAAYGTQAFAKWEADRKSFDPRIADDLVKESKLASEYTALKAQAKLEFRGETYNLSTIIKHHSVADRATREASQRTQWDWYAQHAEQLDSIFDQLVKLRHGMAQKLGFENFVPLGYLLKHRIDYGQKEVERFRAGIRDHIVPICQQLFKEQADRHGVEQLMYWDEKVFDTKGNPVPAGDHDWLMDRATEMFGEIGHGLGEFFAMIREHGLLDLKSRDGKAGGGFCTNFPSFNAPFIFANFNGTQNDARVFTHEVGHAFQKYMSKGQPLLDYQRATSETAEVHSMSLEYITWPWMDSFFGEAEGKRFRTIHLAQSLEFLPYGTAVDHFQHLIYEKPNATPDERAEMWQEMERTYLPWRNYGDLPHVSRGRLWQGQLHIYRLPFYYIDYVLANVCALQFWVRSETDREEAMKAYTDLCARGGEAPFQELVRSAGLTSPFDEGCLKQVADHARDWLGAQS